jgi:hypothetical protein
VCGVVCNSKGTNVSRSTRSTPHVTNHVTINTTYPQSRYTIATELTELLSY